MRINPSGAPAGERVLDGMVELAGCSRLDRVIVAGATASDLMLGLHCRGYARVAAVASCGLPHGQYGVALVNWEGRSIKALATTLDWLVQYLGRAAVLVIRLDPLERTANRKLMSILDNLGFHIEVGALCEQGLAVSACRGGARHMPVAS
jgi:hypothetical protein